jgi:predicted RNase H-like HicB family nuclease
VSQRIRLLELEQGWSVSSLDLPGCHVQGDTRDEALASIREAIGLWLDVEAEEVGIKSNGDRRLVIPRHGALNAIARDAAKRLLALQLF